MTSFMVPTSAPLLDHAGVEAARLVRAGREGLVSGHPSITYALLAEARGQQEASVRQWVRRLRLAGRLCTVEWGGVTLIPSFQFDEAYQPVAQVADVVERLARSGMSGWATWRWFAMTNPWVDERPVALVAARDFGHLGAAADALLADSGE